MTTLPERLQRAAETTWGSPTLRALLSEAAQSLQAQEVVKETTINHARDPHCCGCYVIRWNDGDPVAVCGECGVQVALLDRIVSGAPEGGDTMRGVCESADFEADTLTFRMVGAYYAAAGEYVITPAALPQRQRCKRERGDSLDHKNIMRMSAMLNAGIQARP